MTESEEGAMACVMRETKQKYQGRIIYSTRLSFKTEDEINIFPDKQKLREFFAKIALQETLRGVLQTEK